MKYLYYFRSIIGVVFIPYMALIFLFNYHFWQTQM